MNDFATVVHLVKSFVVGVCAFAVAGLFILAIDSSPMLSRWVTMVALFVVFAVALGMTIIEITVGW